MILSLSSLRQSDAVRAALVKGAERLIALQRRDGGWKGSWRSYVGSQRDASHTTGLAAIGLLEAFEYLGDRALLDSAGRAAAFLHSNVGSVAGPGAVSPRLTAMDVLLLNRLAALTGDGRLRLRAAAEWRHIRGYFYFATPADLEAYLMRIDRRSVAWDLAQYLEAAESAGDAAWADGVAALLARPDNEYCFGTGNGCRLLNLAAAVRALAGMGYGSLYRDEIDALAKMLTDDLGTGRVLGTQEIANALLAFLALGPSHRQSAVEMTHLLVRRQAVWGGWMEEGVQYPHVDGEALRALALYASKRAKGESGGPRRALYLLDLDGDAPWRTTGAHDPVAPFEG